MTKICWEDSPAVKTVLLLRNWRLDIVWSSLKSSTDAIPLHSTHPISLWEHSIYTRPLSMYASISAFPFTQIFGFITVFSMDLLPEILGLGKPIRGPCIQDSKFHASVTFFLCTMVQRFRFVSYYLRSTK
jgi:hypothetical protein